MANLDLIKRNGLIEETMVLQYIVKKRYSELRQFHKELGIEEPGVT